MSDEGVRCWLAGAALYEEAIRISNDLYAWHRFTSAQGVVEQIAGGVSMVTEAEAALRRDADFALRTLRMSEACVYEGSRLQNRGLFKDLERQLKQILSGDYDVPTFGGSNPFFGLRARLAAAPAPERRRR